jgi:hypothetical protein
LSLYFHSNNQLSLPVVIVLLLKQSTFIAGCHCTFTLAQHAILLFKVFKRIIGYSPKIYISRK